VPRVTPKPKVAGFCAALWLDFTPALTVMGRAEPCYGKQRASARIHACHSGAFGLYRSSSILLREEIGSSAVLQKYDMIAKVAV
jgi:hypothetical protein